jgi:stress-induced morphogen
MPAMPSEPTSGGPVERAIEDQLVSTFSPVALQVLNESYMHSVPPGSESHFKVVVVSETFDGQRPLARHRSISSALAEQLEAIHALSIEALTPAQWQARGGQVAASPKCRGGGAVEREISEIEELIARG